MTSTTTTQPQATDTAQPIIPCDDRCMFAKLDDCDCVCGGVNHKRGGELTAEQRAIVRTPKGRRIRVLEPGTEAFATARELTLLYDSGSYTREELAAEYGVSDTTVRRNIQRYLATAAAYGAEAYAANDADTDVPTDS